LAASFISSLDTAHQGIELNAAMAVVTGKRLLRADGHHSRSASNEREGDGNKCEDSLHRCILSGVERFKKLTYRRYQSHKLFGGAGH